MEADKDETIARLEAELAQARLDLELSDQLRERIVMATVSSSTVSFDMAVALARIEALTALADAAVELKQAVLEYTSNPAIVGTVGRQERVAAARLKFNRLVDAYQKAKENRS